MTRRHPSMRELLAPPLADRTAEEPARRPVITISRLPGAGGRALALELGARLGIDVHDRDILHGIAERTGLSDSSVKSLEEPGRSPLTEWLTPFVCDAHLEPHGYRDHLTHVVQDIARAGGAVILGRGAHLILSHGEALRVLVAAPIEARIVAVAARHGTSLREAERRIRVKEDERRVFLARFFRADADDPALFDLVVNTGVLRVSGAADAVLACLEADSPHRAA